MKHILILKALTVCMVTLAPLSLVGREDENRKAKSNAREGNKNLNAYREALNEIYRLDWSDGALQRSTQSELEQRLQIVHRIVTFGTAVLYFSQQPHVTSSGGDIAAPVQRGVRMAQDLIEILNQRIEKHESVLPASQSKDVTNNRLLQ